MKTFRFRNPAFAVLALGAVLLPLTANAGNWGIRLTEEPVLADQATYYGSGGAYQNPNYLYPPQGRHMGGYDGYGRGHNRGYDGRRHGGYRDYPRPRFCQPQEAVEKAQWLGLRRAGIQRVTPEAIVVTGGYNGYWARIVFDRQSPNCRVISSQGI